MIEQDEEGLWISLIENIASHHEEVFGCLTTASGLARWFPVAARIDLRQGGEIVLGWDEHFRQRTTVAILDYDAGGRIVWDWQTRRSDTHAPVYWTVEPEVESGSIVRFRQGPFREDHDALIGMAEEVESWRWHLSNLRSVLEARHDMRRVRPL
jgi:uncharacterized protein YndB with AHSA1/START domain